MPNYIINKNSQPNGDHEVHNATTGCSYMPNVENQIKGFEVQRNESVR